MICNWIGESFNNISSELRSYLSGRFNICDCGDDFSVITQKDVSLVIFCLNNENKNFFDMCIKICENLDKKLITVSKDGSLPNQKQNKHIYFHTDISESKALIPFHNSLNKLIKNSQNNNNLTNLTSPDQITTESGTKIDIYRVIEFLDDNLNTPVSEAELAKSLNYSAPYFSKIFHKTIGMSFRDYMTSQRISLSKKLLRENPHEKIETVAYQCGYNDVSYFSRIFKKKTGITPGEYRKTSQ